MRGAISGQATKKNVTHLIHTFETPADHLFLLLVGQASDVEKECKTTMEDSGSFRCSTLLTPEPEGPKTLACCVQGVLN